jgi:glucokinase
MTATGTTRSVIGVDVGGTKTLALRVVLDDPAGSVATPVLDRELSGSCADSTDAYDVIEAAVAALVERAVTTGQPAPAAIGVGMAGFIDRQGIATSSPNTPGLVGVDVGGRLAARFGVPVVVENDANCVAIAAHAELAADVADMAAVTLGTGIGGGFVVAGELVRGAHGFAGEPGHMVIDPAGPECPCGQRGCWERYASGNGLGWLGREAAAAGRGASLVRAAGSLEAIRGETVTDLLEQDDPEAEAVFAEFAGYVALGVANLLMLLDPEVVVIGGGLAALGERLADPVRAALTARFPAAVAYRELRLVVAPEGPDAGARGAALLAARRLRSEPG